MIHYNLQELDTLEERELVREIFEDVSKDLFGENVPEIYVITDHTLDGLGYGWKSKAEVYAVSLNLSVFPILEHRKFLTWLISHEMRHIRQYFDGIIRETRNAIYWYGQKYVTDCADMAEYTKLPWELDANQYSIAYAKLSRDDVKTHPYFEDFSVLFD